MYGVRLSFALSDWLRLGEVYPPAREAMYAVRDKKRDLLLNEEGAYELFHDVFAFNRTLEAEDLTIELFQSIEKLDPGLAQECWRIVAPLILDSALFEVAQRYLTDLQKAYDDVKCNYERNLTLYDNPAVGNPKFIEFNEDTFAKEVTRLVAFAVATDKETEGEQIRSAAYELMPDERLLRDRVY